MVGSGSYRQVVRQQRVMFRWEFELRLDGGTLSVQQISDGRRLWIRRDGAGESTVGAVDLQALNSRPLGNRSFAGGSFVGGLAQWMRGLDRAFQFGPPQRITHDEKDAWKLTGRWRAEQLVELLPEREDQLRAGNVPSTDQLPEHLPDQVVLILGTDDRLPLFPHRIEYRRTLEIADNRPGESALSRPLAIVEFFHVEPQAEIDLAIFTFQPDGEPVENLTGQFQERWLSPP